MLGTPAIFIRVSQYKTWINSVIRTSQPGYITFKSNGTDSDLSVSCKAPPRLTTTPSPTTTTVDGRSPVCLLAFILLRQCRYRVKTSVSAL